MVEVPSRIRSLCSRRRSRTGFSEDEGHGELCFEYFFWGDCSEPDAYGSEQFHKLRGEILAILDEGIDLAESLGPRGRIRGRVLEGAKRGSPFPG